MTRGLGSGRDRGRADARVGRAEDERGFTLVEIAVTLAILGSAVVAVASGLLVSVKASDLARRQALAQSELGRYAEAVRSVPYKQCATNSSYAGAVTSIYTPEDSTVTFGAGDTVQFWVGPTADPSNVPTTWGTSTAAGCPTSDQGIQKITLNVSVGTGVSASTTIIKRATTS